MMLIKKCYFNVLWLLVTIGVLYSVECTADDKSDSDYYIAGFIKDDETNDAVPGAIVVITHDHKKISSTRSVQGGWFETLMALDKGVLEQIKDQANHKTKITILKRGYKFYEDEVKFANNRIMFDIKLTRIKGVVFDKESTTYPTRVKYGYVYNDSSDSKEPVKGAVIVVEKQSIGDPKIVSSAVTRESGYFSLYYQKKYESKKMQYILEHYQHNTKGGSISLDGKNELSNIPITQDKFSFSIGLGLHLQTISLFEDQSLTETGDLETGAAVSLNLAWYPNEHVVVNGFLPRYKKTGIVGGELTIGMIPYRETKTGKDEVGETYVMGLGLVYAIKHSPFQLRMGLTRSDTDKNAFYIGINVPFIFF